jgi:lycopene cyclase domain-containing protein
MNTTQPDRTSRTGSTRKPLYLVWWVAGVLVQVTLSLPFIYKEIHWRALLIASGILTVVMTVVESIALQYRWWYWDHERLIGIDVGNIPLEEFVLYILVVPSVVSIQLLVHKGLQHWRILHR